MREILEKGRSRKRRSKKAGRIFISLVSLLMLCLCTVSGTAAFIATKTDPIENRFRAAKVTCGIDEEFDGKTKTSITVKNTGTAPAYVRVRLISYRINEEGERIGGPAEIPTFSRGKDWIEGGNDTYYYRYPIDMSGSAIYPDTTTNLIAEGSKIELKLYPESEGGGRQVIEVIAEAIQGNTTEAIEDAWPGEIVSQLSSDMQRKTVFDISRE